MSYNIVRCSLNESNMNLGATHRWTANAMPRADAEAFCADFTRETPIASRRPHCSMNILQCCNSSTKFLNNTKHVLLLNAET